MQIPITYIITFSGEPWFKVRCVLSHTYKSPYVFMSVCMCVLPLCVCVCRLFICACVYISVCLVLKSLIMWLVRCRRGWSADKNKKRDTSLNNRKRNKTVWFGLREKWEIWMTFIQVTFPVWMGEKWIQRELNVKIKQCNSSALRLMKDLGSWCSFGWLSHRK